MDRLSNLFTTSETTSSILWAPYIPAIYLWAGLVVVLILFIYSAGHKIKGSLLRLLTALYILLVIANPVWVDKTREAQNDIALILIDDSPSQKINDRMAQVEVAKNHLKSQLRSKIQIQAQVQNQAQSQTPGSALEIRTFYLSDLTESENQASETLITTALQRAVLDIPAGQYAGAVLITDGQIHDKEEDINNLSRQSKFRDKPLHILLTGAENEIDRRISLLQIPGYGMVGEEATITLQVDQFGINDKKNVDLILWADGQETKNLNIPVGIPTDVKIPLERRGRLKIALQVPEIPDEISLNNNQTAISINAVRDRLKVLLVSGVPHPGERTWRNLLKSDPSVDLVHFTILRPPEKQDNTPVNELSLIAFPTTELFQTRLNDFDLIVFDRYRRSGVLHPIYLQNIVNYVEEGGALLEISGPGYAGPFSLYRTSLGEILPGKPNGMIHQQAFKPELTGEGLRHPVTARLPMGPVVSIDDDIRWGRWLRQISVEAKEGYVLMTGADDQPLLILNRIGKGRIAQLFSDQIWLWAKGYEGGGPYSELIRRLSHWLMKEPELEENDLKAHINGDRLLVEMRSLEPQNPTVSVEGPDANVVELRLRDLGNGRYLGEKQLDIMGLHQVSAGERTVLATENARQNKEWHALNATIDHIEPLATATNGSFHFIKDGLPDIHYRNSGRYQAGKNWINLVKNNAFKITGVTYRHLIDGWAGLVMAIALLMLCWRREAR